MKKNSKKILLPLRQNGGDEKKLSHINYMKTKIIIFPIILFIFLQGCENNNVEMLLEKCADEKMIATLNIGPENWNNKINEIKNKKLNSDNDEKSWNFNKWMSGEEYDFGFEERAADGTIYKSDGTIIKPDGTIITRIEQLQEKINLRKKEISDFKQIELDKKLLNYKFGARNYESIFKDCVKEYNEDNLTFKAKWKR